MIATLVSGLVPARRATQVEPVEAMRDADTPGAPRGSAASGCSSSIAVIGLGLAALLPGCSAAPAARPRPRCSGSAWS